MTVQSAALTLPADRARVLRTLGGVGTAAGLLFAAMSIWQHAAGLESGSSGPAYALDQGGFAVAMVGYVALLLGVHIARPGGDGRVARIFTALVAAAWVAFLASMAVAAVSSADPAADVLGPIAGLAQGIGLLGAGVMTARARRWSGWRRYAPLGLAVVFLGVVFAPAIAGLEPNAMTETIWALAYSGLGVALLTEQGSVPSRGQYVLGAVVVAAAITSAAVVTFSTTAVPTSAVPEPSPLTVLREGPIGSVGTVLGGPTYGSADSLDRQVPSGSATFGSADSLERQVPSGSATFGSADGLERQAG